MNRQKISILATFLITLFTLVGCQNKWHITVYDNKKEVSSITKNDVSFYIDKSIEEVEVIPLGQMLYASGFTLIEEITVTSKEGETSNFTWDDIADQSTISEKGELVINAESWFPVELDVTPSPLSSDIAYSIMDISPTIANALGLSLLPNAVGTSRLDGSERYDHAVMILMDGTQYYQLNKMINDGQLSFLDNQEGLLRGLTVYPPITTSSSASLLTGAPPIETGVFGYGFRSTDLTTLFDLAVENEKTVIAIEGTSLPFNLRNADTSLSGDKDGNGYSDDNVFMNSMDVIQDQMPDLLYIHFHEIDDMGHSYGPESTEYASALIRVDTYLSQIVEALPANTFIAIFADHGMHTTSDGGNHGSLKANDLIIPILFLTK